MSEEARSILLQLAKKLGVSQVAIMEIALRKLAEKEGVVITTNDEEPKQK